MLVCVKMKEALMFLSMLFFGSGRLDSNQRLKCKLLYITFDEKTATEKKQAMLMLVQADNFRHALERLEEEMSGTTIDYEVASITESTVMEVFFYEAGNGMTEERAVASIIPEGATSVDITVDGKGYAVRRTASGIRVTPTQHEECSRQTRKQKPESDNG